MRLAHVISDTNIGGGGRSLLNYLAFCDRARFSPAVILPRGSALLPRVQALDVPVHEADGLADQSFNPAAILPLRRLLRTLKPHLVHTHGALSGRVAARLAGLPVVYTKHCAFPPGSLATVPPARLLRGVADGLLADGVVAVGPSARTHLEAAGIPPRRIHVLLNGVAPLPTPTPEERAALRTQYGFGPGDFVAGILARVEEYKGHGTLMESAEKLLAQGRPLRLLVAGEGPFLPELRRRAQSLPPGTVVFAGFVPAVEQALGAMDVQVNASYVSETSSLSLLEGMSMGLPAVASDCGGNPDLIRPGANGLLFPQKDAAALARCLERLMDEPELVPKLGAGARAVFEREFTGEIFARNLERVYEDVWKGAHP